MPAGAFSAPELAPQGYSAAKIVFSGSKIHQISEKSMILYSIVAICGICVRYADTWDLAGGPRGGVIRQMEGKVIWLGPTNH